MTGARFGPRSRDPSVRVHFVWILPSPGSETRIKQERVLA